MSTTESSSGKILVWGMFLLMFILHQDKWWWNDGTLVLGFLPVGLAFHAAFSLGCALLGWTAIKFAWPHDLEAFAETETTVSEKVEGSS